MIVYYVEGEVWRTSSSFTEFRRTFGKLDLDSMFHRRIETRDLVVEHCDAECWLSSEE